MKRKFMVFLVLLILISITAVSAGDANQTDADYGLDFDKSTSDFDKLSSGLDESDSELDFDKSTSECCSFVIQEENETVFGFRQDGKLNGYGVVIHNESLDDLDSIVEEIDNPEVHFIHAIISEDGWVASHGGDSDNVTDTLTIENLAKEMLLSKNISSDSLGQIQNIFKKYKYGHFFIKAPDGSYGVAYYTGCKYGTLQPGEFMIISNEYFGLRKGTYADYAIDPVDAIVEICSYENTGWNRRNVHIYDYKAHDTPEGQKYGVDVYISDDNGLNVGLETSEIVTYVYFNGEYHPASEIPQNPDKLYLGTYIFENQTIDSVFEVVYSSDNVLVNEDSPIIYKINNIDDERTVVFELDDNVEYVDADVSEGDCNYDPAQNILYWNLPASNGPKEIIFTVRPKVKGDYTIRSYVQGMDEEISVTTYATNPGVILTAENVTTYKSYYKNLDIYLTDEDGVALVGEKVSIMIDGTTYEREVTPKGYASYSIMLQPGEYDAIISYDGQFGKNQTTSKIIVKTTIFSNDLEVFYGQNKTFDVSLLDENGNAFAEGVFDFKVDGNLRSQLTDENGSYGLKIYNYLYNVGKLYPGNHTIITYNGRTNEFVSNTLIIKEPVCDLVISKTANVSSILIGDGFKWTINVLNNGPCDAHDVLATDVLPSNVKYVSYEASKGFYDVEGGIWTIGNLTVGESATLDLYCIALEEGIITNEVNVICNETDSNLSNNYDNSTVKVIKNETQHPAGPVKNMTEDPTGILANPARMSATGNPIAYLIVVIMILFGSFWTRNRKN
ncbi:hypothetical protein [Methanobrevibacter sp.]|uniref:hypothetical protein n=1 Tax=Methanobrevibacter sp. TaxID=66852 RepID=UPI00388FC008